MAEATTETVSSESVIFTSCYWLNGTDETDRNTADMLNKLRCIIKDVHILTNVDDCESYIKSARNENVLLITPNKDGDQLLSKIHHIPQLTAFYVFCQNTTIAEQWTNPYTKIRGIFTDFERLLEALGKDCRTEPRVEDLVSISVVNVQRQQHEQRDAKFLWFQLYIEVLLRMHHKSIDREDMIKICRDEFSENEDEKKIIDEFEKDYVPEKAIWWYTRNTCFYRKMNQALRDHELDSLFAFRSFIKDVTAAIKNEYEQNMLQTEERKMFHVYRGEVVPDEIFNLLQGSIGQLLSMNSFLSTSRCRSIALRFTRREKGPNTKRILFEIEINPSVRTKYYADIRNKSFYKSEREVLIMLGALFLIKSVERNEEDRVWIVKVDLAKEDDYQLRNLYDYMKDKIGDDANLNTLGQLLLRMGEHEKAKNCYQKLLQETNLTLSDSYMGLGWSSLRAGSYSESHEYFMKSLEIRTEIYGDTHPKVAEIHSFIGEVYRMQDKIEDAMLSLTIAQSIQEQTLEQNSTDLAATYQSIGKLNIKREKYDSALKNFEHVLRIRKVLFPADHPQIAFIHHDIGHLLSWMNKEEEARVHFDEAYRISRHSLPAEHALNVGLAMLLTNP